MAMTHRGTTVFVSTDGDTYSQLSGYSGGLSLGMTATIGALSGSDDGITRGVKESLTGATSTVSVRRTPGDAGAVVVQMLCEDDDGAGYIRVVYPDGRTLTAQGLFHSLVHNPITATAAQGFSFSFSQQELEV